MNRPTPSGSRPTWWLVVLGIALGALALSACIIGPKHEDPSDEVATVADTGMGFDANPSDGTSGDAPPPPEDAPVSDTGVAGDSDKGDVGKGPCSDGGDAGGDADGGCPPDGGDAGDAAPDGDAPDGDAASDSPTGGG